MKFDLNKIEEKDFDFIASLITEAIKMLKDEYPEPLAFGLACGFFFGKYPEKNEKKALENLRKITELVERKLRTN